MTEQQVDLDALIAEARGRAGEDMGLSDQLLRELSSALESTLAERDEARKAAEDHVLDAEATYERLSAELRQERERYDLATSGWRKTNRELIEIIVDQYRKGI